MKNSKLAFFVFVAFIVLFVGFRVVGLRRSKEAWALFESPDKDFSILVPYVSPPAVMAIPTIHGRINFQLHNANSTGVEFRFAFARIAEGIMDQFSQKELLALPLALLTSTGNKMVDQDLGTWEGHPSVTTHWETPDGTLRVISRSVLRQDRFYLLEVVVAKDAFEGELPYIEKFLKSFHIQQK